MKDVTGRVGAILGTCLGRDRVDLDDGFDEQGIDSLDVLDLRFRLEEEFGRDIPDERMRGFRRGRDVVAFLEERGGHPAARPGPDFPVPGRRRRTGRLAETIGTGAARQPPPIATGTAKT